MRTIKAFLSKYLVE